jgi:putative transposase
MRYRRIRQSGATYFFTVITGDPRPLFAQPQAVAIFKKATRTVQLRHPLVIEAEVIMPDHIHTIWTLPENDSDFSKRWMLIKSSFSREYRRDTVSGFASGLTPAYNNNAMSRPSRGQRSIWQNRFWEHLIRDERDFSTHVEYIHFNPVKHGLAKSAIDWPHSTFKQFVDRGEYDASWGASDMPPLPEWAGKE